MNYSLSPNLKNFNKILSLKENSLNYRLGRCVNKSTLLDPPLLTCSPSFFFSTQPAREEQMQPCRRYTPVPRMQSSTLHSLSPETQMVRMKVGLPAKPQSRIYLFSRADYLIRCVQSIRACHVSAPPSCFSFNIDNFPFEIIANFAIVASFFSQQRHKAPLYICICKTANYKEQYYLLHCCF